MDQKTENNINFTEKLITLLKENKTKIFTLLFIVIVICACFVFLKIMNQKKIELASEKYIQAGIFLNLGDTQASKKMYEEIILSKSKFYSILALNTVIEKKLDFKSEKILEFFNEVEKINLSKDQKNLIMLKKGLYLIDNSQKDLGIKLLEEIIKSESNLKSIAEEVLLNKNL